MSIFDLPTDEGIVNAELFFNFFKGGQESIMTSEAAFLEFDENSPERDRTITTSQVVDCIVVSIWGKTPENRDFIALVHKAGPDTVEELIEQYKAKFNSKLSYVVIPGPESGQRPIDETKNECLQLFGQNESAGTIPNLQIIKSDHRSDKTSVAIRGKVGEGPEMLVVKPNYGY